MILKNAQNETK